MLEIVGVLVKGELPKTCMACDLFATTMYEGYDWCMFDYLTEEDIPIDYYDKLKKKGERPLWCPLTNLITDITSKIHNQVVINEVVEKRSEK